MKLNRIAPPTLAPDAPRARTLETVAAEIQAANVAMTAAAATLAGEVEAENARLAAVDAAFAQELTTNEEAIATGLAAGDMPTVRAARDACETLQLQRGQVRVDMRAAALRHAEGLVRLYQDRLTATTPLFLEFDALFGQAITLRDEVLAAAQMIRQEVGRYDGNVMQAQRAWEDERTALTVQLRRLA